MSRYGPGVLPQGFDARGIVDALLRGVNTTRGIQDDRRQRTRQDAADERLQDLYDLQFHERGGRYGEAPFTAADELADEPLPRTSVTSSAPPVHDPAGEARGIDVAGLSTIAQDLTALRGSGPAAPAPTPGEFIPGQGFAGLSRPRFEPRYEQVRPEIPGQQRGIYYDREESPAGIARADRAATREDNQAARAHEIGLRSTAAANLEGMRQRGRLELRDKINQAGILAIQTRGAEQRRTDVARGSTAAGRGQTANSREANALKIAEGVIVAAGGKYDDAVDWLENTPEGQDAAKNGLAKRHLYAQLGRFIAGTTKQAVSLQTGTMGVDPEKAVQQVETTRDRVSAGARSAAAPPDAAARDAWSKANPPLAGETLDQYRARYEASKKK